MNVDRALVFKSLDAKKQNPQNRPGKFTVKFFPELFLENNKQHFLALDHLSMTASWHNIRPEYDNNKLVISKDEMNEMKHGKQSHFQQEFLIMVTSMNSFTKELEKLGFLFYSI